MKKRHQVVRQKFITPNQLIGQKGINLIEAAVMEMGYVWKPTTATTDAGIDGDIEIRDPQTGEATNFIIRVQSKATEGELEAETDNSFVYRVKENDLAYWLRGNAPVILVVAKLATKELFWSPIKEYFNTAEKQKQRKIVFDKTKQRFDKISAKDVADLALPLDRGIYMNPPPKQETLVTNLLEVSRYADKIYIAQTAFSTSDQLNKAIKESGEKPGRLWFVKEKKLYSFHKLDEPVWSKWIDPGSVEIFNSSEWANTTDFDKRSEFVRLLNQSLRTFCARKDLAAFTQEDGSIVFYFRPYGRLNRETGFDEAVERDETWHTQKENNRRVVERYYSKKDPKKLLYFRHHAFTGSFRRFNKRWYLELNPTYHYTIDGKTVSPFREENLSGMKRQEGHASVSNNVRFLAYYLSFHDLIRREYFALRFEKLIEGQIEAGIYDKDWANRTDADETLATPAEEQAQAQTTLALS
jgi:hypothetical protein